MFEMTGTVKGYEIGKNRDGTQDVLLLQCAISTPEDIQPVEYYSGIGDNSIPIIGSIVTILEAGRSWKIAIAANDGKDFDSSLNEGEKYLYSKDEAATIRILNDGSIEINGDADFAVAFNDLKSGFDQLKSDLNAFITVFNAHVHAETGVTTSPTATPGTSSAASIDGSKVETVKLP